MRHPLAFLLRYGRSEDERVSMLGDFDEEHRARRARGDGRLSAFAWYTLEILGAFGWGLRDTIASAFALRTSSLPDAAGHHGDDAAVRRPRV